MTSNFAYYAFALVALIVGFFIIKKVTTCLFKTLVALIVLAVLATVYWLYFT